MANVLTMFKRPFVAKGYWIEDARGNSIAEARDRDVAEALVKILNTQDIVDIKWSRR